MSVGYTLINRTKREQISFAHLPANTAREIAGYPPAAAVTAWYLLKRSGDEIAFVADDSGQPFPDVHLDEYQDVTDAIIEELVKNGVLEDRGVSWRDEDEPTIVFMRDLRVCWGDD